MVSGRERLLLLLLPPGTRPAVLSLLLLLLLRRDAVAQKGRWRPVARQEKSSRHCALTLARSAPRRSIVLSLRLGCHLIRGEGGKGGEKVGQRNPEMLLP